MGYTYWRYSNYSGHREELLIILDKLIHLQGALEKRCLSKALTIKGREKKCFLPYSFWLPERDPLEYPTCSRACRRHPGKLGRSWKNIHIKVKAGGERKEDPFSFRDSCCSLVCDLRIWQLSLMAPEVLPNQKYGCTSCVFTC